jgi:hypothetical protein
VRKELGIQEAECIAADANLTLLDVKRTVPAAAPAAKAAAKSRKAAKKKTAKRK